MAFEGETNEFHRRTADELSQGRPELTRVVIPTASVVEPMGVGPAPLVTWSPSNPAPRALKPLWQEVVRRW